MTRTAPLVVLVSLAVVAVAVAAGCGGDKPGFLGDQKALERNLRANFEHNSSSDVSVDHVACAKGENRTYQCSVETSGTSSDAPLAVTLTVAEDGGSYTGRVEGGGGVSGHQ